jgi:NAD(P)-dependent dehydrogenase (short-subunit alcohol dehydrogenase family)
MKMNQSVAGVTGASQGIGGSTSIRLARDFSAISEKLIANDE